MLGAAGADVTAADAASALADAVGEAVVVVVVVVVVVAAAIAGDVAAGGRRDFLNCSSATMPRSERRAQLRQLRSGDSALRLCISCLPSRQHRL